MMHVGSDTTPATSVPVGVSRAGVVCLVAGILGAASGIFLAVYPGQVPGNLGDGPAGVPVRRARPRLFDTPPGVVSRGAEPKPIAAIA